MNEHVDDERHRRVVVVAKYDMHVGLARQRRRRDIAVDELEEQRVSRDRRPLDS